MSAQFHQTVQQWAELEAEGRYESEARRIEDANAALQEISEAREREDEQYRRELEAKFPILKGWL